MNEVGGSKLVIKSFILWYLLKSDIFYKCDNYEGDIIYLIIIIFR